MDHFFNVLHLIYHLLYKRDETYHNPLNLESPFYQHSRLLKDDIKSSFFDLLLTNL